ncbi:TPA: hypothetical protein L3615_006123 [Pseudomonas aeruginosa]|nr:hypothetical protein [Pseudomonas aeruginosa]HBN9013941.1 hypothetical protein [Pseudomonas aeruginosa]
MSLLTLEDLAWLRQYRESLSGWSRYQFAKLRGASCGELMEIAGQVLVFDRDRYVLAQDLAVSLIEEVQKEAEQLSWSHEQWTSACAYILHHAASLLSKSDGEVLIAAGGFTEQALEDFLSVSPEAIHEDLAIYG